MLIGDFLFFLLFVLFVFLCVLFSYANHYSEADQRLYLRRTLLSKSKLKQSSETVQPGFFRHGRKTPKTCFVAAQNSSAYRIHLAYISSHYNLLDNVMIRLTSCNN